MASETHPDHPDHTRHDHDHGHGGLGHVHGAEALRDGRVGRVTASLIANVILLVIQVIGAFAAGSLALLSDSAHQASDVLGLALAVAAVVVTRRPADDKYTYGMRRVDVLGGLAIGALLCASSVYVVVEAIPRLAHPQPVTGRLVIYLAVLSIVINSAAALLLARDRHSSVAISGALTHLMTDAIGSAIVLVVGIIISLGGSPRWDSIAALVAAAVVMYGGIRLLRRSTTFLLDQAPVSTAAVREALVSDGAVEEVHHIHVWPLDAEHAAVSAHVVINGERTVHQSQEDADRLRAILRERFGIDHATLQIECHPCAEPAH
jgi:cobalt-zinc-cadmium efflux system protein